MRRLQQIVSIAWVVIFLVMNLADNSAAQSQPEARERPRLPIGASPGTWNAPESVLEPNASGSAAGGVGWLKRFGDDQRAIWSSPLHLRRGDAVWAIPALAGAGVFLSSDAWLSRQVPAAEIVRSRSFSNDGAYSLAGAAGGMFLFGKIMHNDHAAETGFLASEAAVNAAAVDFAFKSMFQRQRPYQGAGAGRFFSGGSSFPSEHAAVSWAIAGVVAHEYSGPLTKLISYGLATAVTAARVTGKEHFASDAIVGGALGYFIARQIYLRHRDPEVSEGAWGSLLETKPYRDKIRNPHDMGSSYVPLDSWVYPSLERLAALGYLSTAFLGIRPWTRMECARLLEEMDEDGRMDYPEGGPGKEAQKTYAALQIEFNDETARLNGVANLDLRLDSIYTRSVGISGKPLRDGFHFGQTVVNDYGRPYGEGFNQVTGLSASAVAGVFSFSLRGEYQHAPVDPSDPLSVLQAIAQVDGLAIPVPDGSPTINRFRLIEASVGVTFHDIKVSFGKQNLWLGPGESGALLMTDNAQPITMLQIDNVSPFDFPLLSYFLGPARIDSFIGQLSGQLWVYNPSLAVGLNPATDPSFLLGPGFSPQPFIHGNKIGFRPTPNLEFGMGVTAIFGGPGLPFTWHEFFRSYYGHNVNTATNPGKRFSSFDFTYRIPGLRRWLTFYTDSMVGDEISPIGSTRPMLNPGLYLPQLPKLPKLELRVEGFKAEPQLGTIYFDRRYRSGYTNDGNLIGSWIGRQALGGQAWTKYSFTARSSLQLGYRHQEVDKFLAGGGRLNDFSAEAEFRVGPRVAVSGRAQYEQWDFPALSGQKQSNVTAGVQLTYYPGWKFGN